MRTWAWIVAPALLLSGCQKKAEAPPAETTKTTLHEIMKDEVDTRGDDVWAVGNAHIDGDAGLDGASMTDADWAKLAAAATSLRQAALDIVNLPKPIVVVKPGTKIAYEDTSWGDSAASVQANVDKDPQGLIDLANALAQHGADIATAAGKHDAETAGRLINELDGVCESCHVKYWYPSEKKLIESIRESTGEDPTT
jgi:hypothetical protein